MKKIIDWILSSIYVIHFGLSLLIFHVIQVIAYNIFGKKAHQKTVDYLNFFLNYGLLLTGARIRFENRTQLPEHRPIIFIANHQSTFDIPGLIWFLRNQHPIFVSKIELAKGIPSISYNLRKSGAAVINRKDSKQAIAEISRLGKLMHESNRSTLIFPEGTRTASGQMREFNVGGIATLLKRCPNALLVPITIQGTGKLNPKGAFPLVSFSDLSWTVLPGIEPNGKTVDEMLIEVRSAIQAVLDEPVR